MDQQEVWLCTCLAAGRALAVPADRLRANLQSFATPIVEACYAALTPRVMDTLMGHLVNRFTADDGLVTVFEFTALFQGKPMAPFVENLAHEGEHEGVGHRTD